MRVFRARFGALEGKTLAAPGEVDFYGVREYLKRVCYGNKVVHAQDRVALDALIDCIFADSSLDAHRLELFGIDLPSLDATAEDASAALSRLPDDVKLLGLQPAAKAEYARRELAAALGEAATLEGDGEARAEVGEDTGTLQLVSRLLETVRAGLESARRVKEAAQNSSESTQISNVWFADVAGAVIGEARDALAAARLVEADLVQCKAFLEGLGRTNRACSLAVQLRAGKTPTEWDGISADPKLERRAGAFVDALAARVTYSAEIETRIRSLPKESEEIDLFAGGVLEIAKLGAPAALLAGLRQAHARLLGVALDRVVAHYTLAEASSESALILRGVKLQFAESCGNGTVQGVNALYSAPVDIKVTFAVTEPGTDEEETKFWFPVYANHGRREQIFRLSASCADERRAMIEGVCGVVRVLE